LKVITYKPEDKVHDILFFMLSSVLKDGEPCVTTLRKVIITMAPDEKKLIRVPEAEIKIAEA